ncbi:hypothetical protein CBR_g26513 [Chara braunii]|uniref:Reverse transcriptase domain-containing protein n=1 Tax=Chara braunii TaxID=69332 RepID=A0A388L848_CHABU|nr:hypothetical protein CBR_g26513 [Chara braunii]|eukprot:GBG78485.1 hypothetical protein CBR_g26513 [Chara braunii]
MNRIFHDYLDTLVIVYLDDILIFSRTIEEHVGHLDKVLSLLRQHKFKINGEKCEFGRTRILYLGHEISPEGLKPDDAKVASIRDWPHPQSVTEMRSFLGMTGYYRNFVKNYSIVAAPLTDLTRLDTPWEWTDRSEAAFKHLKHALTHYEVLKLPDPDKLFIVTTDASQYGIGAVLAQQEGPKLRDVRFTRELWKATAAEQGTQLQMTSGNHPEANGQAEQLNRAVQHLLRHYIKPNQVDWDEKLALIASLYNNAVHSATGVSSNSLLLTFKPRLPLDFLLPENQPTAAPGTLEFANRYEQFMQQALEQMHRAQAAMIDSENKHRHPSTFQERARKDEVDASKEFLEGLTAKLRKSEDERAELERTHSKKVALLEEQCGKEKAVLKQQADGIKAELAEKVNQQTIVEQELQKQLAVQGQELKKLQAKGEAINADLELAKRNEARLEGELVCVKNQFQEVRKASWFPNSPFEISNLI